MARSKVALLGALLLTPSCLATSNSTVAEVASPAPKFMSKTEVTEQASPASKGTDNTDMTSAAMEKALTDLMLGNSQFAATPMGGSVKKIEDLLTKNMMPKIIAAHKSDQARLYQLANAIKKCGGIRDANLRKAQPTRNLYLRNSRYHRSCRSQEAVRLASKKACLNDQMAKYREKRLRCDYFAALSKRYGTQKDNIAIVKKAGSEKTEQYIRRISGTICGKHWHGSKGQISRKGGYGGGLPGSMLDKYLRAKEKCEIAKRVYQAKVRECKAKYHAYQVQRAKCNQYQSLMDSNSCKHAVLVKDTCEAYSGCYFAKRRDYRLFERTSIQMETDRKAEWRGVKRMECLIKAFSDGKVTGGEVDACKKQSHSTKHLTLKYPKIPPLKTCNIPKLFPATGEYKVREFKPLPTMAKGQQSPPCAGMDNIPTSPRPGSPKRAKCTRVALLGFYSPGALIKCENGHDVRRSLDRNSCPQGTKIFAPRTRSDWKTILASVDALRAPHWIIDVTRPARGCGGCRNSAMNSQNKRQKSWRTSDGSAWWLRSTRYNEPNGDYEPNCFLNLWGGKPRNENVVTFNDGKCNYHSRSYYCQPINVVLKPKSGSPRSCKCSKIDLAGKYSAGTLVKCEQCLAVRRSSQKNSCPNGMKIFSPASRGDWKTFLNSAGPLRAPHWIIDITRPQNGCGGCKRYPMKSSTPQQATWKTSDGSPWWLRSSVYNEPNGNYHANCFLNIRTNPTSPDTLHFDDNNCNFYSRSYYCQPKKNNMNYGGFHRRRRAPPPPKPRLKKGCFAEEQFYFGQGSKVPNLNRKPSGTRPIHEVNFGSVGRTWPGWRSANHFAGRWRTVLNVRKGGRYSFWARSDDGSNVYVDNVHIVNNDGLHGMRSRSGHRTLKPGKHTIRIEMFERGGHAGMIFKLKGPDTGNKWTTSYTYGGLTCPQTGIKPAMGVQLNYPMRGLFDAGWKVWSDKPYKFHTTRKDIQPTSGDCIMWGSKRNAGDTKLSVAAFGRRKAIENKNRVWENGVYWYTQTKKNGSGSCGFSANEKLALNSADVMSNNDPTKRLSWHLHTNFKVGGYRSGKTMGLNRDPRWRKVVMYGPCFGVKGGKPK